MTRCGGILRPAAVAAAALLVLPAAVGCGGQTQPLVICGVTFVQGGQGEPAGTHVVDLGPPRPGMPPAPRSSELPPRNGQVGVGSLGAVVSLGNSCSHGFTVIITHASQLWTVGVARASDGGIVAIAVAPATHEHFYVDVYAYRHGRPAGEARFGSP
jgi:hypothetical protein